MRKCWQVNLNVFGDIKSIKKFLHYKIPNLKCRQNFYPLGQAYTWTVPPDPKINIDIISRTLGGRVDKTDHM